MERRRLLGLVGLGLTGGLFAAAAAISEKYAEQAKQAEQEASARLDQQCLEAIQQRFLKEHQNTEIVVNKETGQIEAMLGLVDEKTGEKVMLYANYATNVDGGGAQIGARTWTPTADATLSFNKQSQDGKVVDLYSGKETHGADIYKRLQKTGSMEVGINSSTPLEVADKKHLLTAITTYQVDTGSTENANVFEENQLGSGSDTMVNQSLKYNVVKHVQELFGSVTIQPVGSPVPVPSNAV